MNCWIRTDYGPPSNLQLSTAGVIPEPLPDQVVIKMKSCGLNASDVEYLTGNRGYIRLLSALKFQCLGSDIAGVVHKVGEAVTEFKEGDAVFGDVLDTFGGFGTFCTAKESQLLKIPTEMSFERAAALPQSSTVALQALQKINVSAGEEILIIGAGGGSGSFAIQLSKLLGVKSITCVDCVEKQDFMKSLGAAKVIDYKSETLSGSYDAIIDFIGASSASHYSSYLKPKGRYVMIGGYLSTLLGTLVTGPFLGFSGKQYTILAHNQNKKDMQHIVDLILEGKIKEQIGKSFDFDSVPLALEALMTGTVPGKIIINFK
jgi:NADPH:quinone reductase-like Zn-dependent oxidoreductase